MQPNKIFLFILFILFFGNVLALSNESIEAKNALTQAKSDILEMQEKGILVNRVNETYQDALQVYMAQISLEGRNKHADYKVVIEYAEEISKIKELAIQAKDELEIFMDKFEELKQDTDFGEFEEEYNNILDSFNKERFEETFILIDNGYERMAEIQSSQTTTRIFYLTTTRTIKDFFINYWIEIIIFLGVSLTILFIFWNRIIWFRIRRKLHQFEIQRKTVNNLVKKTQQGYFKTKKMSETEYRIKIRKYYELLREIDRKTMILKEELYKKKREGKLKNPKNKKDKKIMKSLHENVVKVEREEMILPVANKKKIMKKSKKKVSKKKVTKKNNKK